MRGQDMRTGSIFSYVDIADIAHQFLAAILAH
jgi:hypothetical protein